MVVVVEVAYHINEDSTECASLIGYRALMVGPQGTTPTCPGDNCQLLDGVSCKFTTLLECQLSRN